MYFIENIYLLRYLYNISADLMHFIILKRFSTVKYIAAPKDKIQVLERNGIQSTSLQTPLINRKIENVLFN